MTDQPLETFGDLAGALQSDPGVTIDTIEEQVPTEDEAPGVLGLHSVFELDDLANRVSHLGRSAHCPFGDRIESLGARLHGFADEARARLAKDRLPDDAEQQERRREAAAESAEPEGFGT
jgi:hypothetical protein